MMCLEVESFHSLFERMLTEPCIVSKVNEIDGKKESMRLCLEWTLEDFVVVVVEL
jgi:hypothetical protein